jgi:two-component system LytT family response regulator
VNTKKIRTIITDDEESARDILENLIIRFCPDIEIVAKCENIPQAVNEIKKSKPDLVFLDIEMPNYAGYEIIDFFEEIDFKIVFVTAYDKYAIRAFEVAAFDYLLKPIDIQRLQKTIERIKKEFNHSIQKENLSVLAELIQSNKLTNIIISDKGQQLIIPIENIICIEAQESYCNIHTKSKVYTVSKNLKHYENLLETNTEFIRTHKSWLINRIHLIKYSNSDLTIELTNKIIAKLSKYKKADFEEKIMR